jgi:hypothetical protein
MKRIAVVLATLASVSAFANPDKARTDYNKCLAQLATEQRKIDQVMNPASARCDNTGVCIEVTISAGVGAALSRSDAFAKGEDCMIRLDDYEDACSKAGKECDYKTFDEVYRGK